MAFHPSGACVGVATTGGTVRIYDIRQEMTENKAGLDHDANNLMQENFRAMKLQQLYSAHEGAATSLSFHPSGNFLASGAGDSKVCYVTEDLEFQKISKIILHL